MPHESLESLQAGFTAALLDAGAPAPDGVVDPAGRPAPRRFNVYRNNVVVSLTEALADTYPVVARLVGEDFFRAMARLAALDAPPSSPVLLQWGGDLARFIERFEPAAMAPYLADVARIEWAYVEAYHAADAETMPASALAQVPEDRIDDLILLLHPSVRVVASQWPALSIYAANVAGADPNAVAIDFQQGEDVLIARPDWAVDLRQLPVGGAALVAALGRGLRLGTAAAIAGFADPAADLARSIAVLLQAGAFTGFRLADPNQEQTPEGMT